MLSRFLLSLLLLAPTMPAHALSRQCGTASHYGIGDGYDGQRTASGARFNAYGPTAAHPSLPFGTRLLVTNRDNGKQTVVTVNDRGPYYGGRILDLSYGSFSKLASPGQGVARICFSRI
jgi:rare lipoprotein A